MKINTTGLTFERWAAAVNQQLGQSGDVVKIIPGEDWKEWVYRILVLPQISNQRAPRPGYYSDWLSWASAFNMTVVY